MADGEEANEIPYWLAVALMVGACIVLGGYWGAQLYNLRLWREMRSEVENVEAGADSPDSPGDPGGTP